jgi:hypothetical protein
LTTQRQGRSYGALLETIRIVLQTGRPYGTFAGGVLGKFCLKRCVTSVIKLSQSRLFVTVNH